MSGKSSSDPSRSASPTPTTLALRGYRIIDNRRQPDQSYFHASQYHKKSCGQFEGGSQVGAVPICRPRYYDTKDFQFAPSTLLPKLILRDIHRKLFNSVAAAFPEAEFGPILALAISSALLIPVLIASTQAASAGHSSSRPPVAYHLWMTTGYLQSEHEQKFSF